MHILEIVNNCIPLSYKETLCPGGEVFCPKEALCPGGDDIFCPKEELLCPKVDGGLCPNDDEPC
jgi:hypothetical protein